MRNRAIYDYRIFPARVFLQVYGGVRFPDSYLSEDAETKALTDAVAVPSTLGLATGCIS